jgi:hypothetical protein
MSFAGIELSAGCARAVHGGDGLGPQALSVDGDDRELPLFISMEGRRLEVGRAGRALRRQYPHLVCSSFLAVVGTDRQWRAGAHRLDAGKALGLVLDHMRPALAEQSAVVFTLPAYIKPTQAAIVLQAARKAKLPVLGSITAPLALVLAGGAERAPAGPRLVLDADDDAFSWSLVKTSADSAQLVHYRSVPALGVVQWKECLLDAVSSVCIHQSRRDPRDSGSAEQLLFDQLDDVFAMCGQGKMVEVVIRAAQWCQNLILQPQQVRMYCQAMVQEALVEVRAALAHLPNGPPSAVVVSADAAALPGLVDALKQETPPSTPVIALPPDAAARTALRFAGLFHRGQLAQGHIAATAPRSGTAPRGQAGRLPLAERST